MARLTTARRKALPHLHVRRPWNALARVSQFGTPALKAKVRAAVHRRYPSIGRGKSLGELAKG